MTYEGETFLRKKTESGRKQVIPLLILLSMGCLIMLLPFVVKADGLSQGQISITVSIRTVNAPLVVSDIPDVVFPEDGSYSGIDLDDYVHDSNNGDDEISWRYAGNTNVNVFIDPTTHEVTFSALPNWNGSETITFTATDPGNLSDSHDVLVTVSAVNDRPVADDQSVITNEDTPVAITSTASDPDGDLLTYTIVSGPSQGSLSGTAPDLVYTPASGFYGTDSFTFEVSDGTVDSGIATVTITVHASLVIQAFCPVDLVATDPEGRMISKDIATIPLARYTEEDLNSDGDPDDKITIPDPLMGSYSIEVVPEMHAQPMDTFVLSASHKGKSKILADKVEVQDIPADPYSSFMPECSMEPGWNLISIPIRLPDNTIDVALQSIAPHCSSVWTYKTTDTGGEWKRYIAGGAGFLNTLKTIELGKGYWMQMDGSCDLTLDGDEVAYEPIMLKRGWNLVGYNYPKAQPLEKALSSIVGNYSAVWTYDVANGGWKRHIADGPESLNNLRTMEPGKGYWVNATGNCKWTIPQRASSTFKVSIPW